jgi:hypothetical protein
MKVIDRIDSIGLLDAARRPAVKLVLGAGFVLYFLYHVTRFQAVGLELEVPNVDTSILFGLAREIYHRGEYLADLKTGNFNAVFPYPPSAVLLLDFLGVAGERIFMAVWTVLMACGLLITFRASVAGENDQTQSGWLALGLASFVFYDSPLSWDLRSGNSNLVYLGMVLAAYGLLRRRPLIAGTLIGLSVSLKLYSALLLLWLLIKGPKKAGYAAAITIIILWLVLPLALFGAAGTVKLYNGWREQVRIVNGLWVYAAIAAQRHAPPLITLRRAAAAMSGGSADAPITRLLMAMAWALWSGALVWYGARVLRYPDPAPAPSRAALADWTILMLAPLPFSPWLEPYHAVPIVPGTILCLVLALDTGEGQRRRATAAAALIGLLAIHAVGVPFDIRGFGLLAQFLIIVIALGLLRPSLARIPDRIGMRISPMADKKIGSARA